MKCNQNHKYKYKNTHQLDLIYEFQPLTLCLIKGELKGSPVTKSCGEGLNFFHGQADVRGGEGVTPSPTLTIRICENFDPFYPMEFDSLIL